MDIRTPEPFQLAPTPDLSHARAVLERYEPDSAEQTDLKERFLAFLHEQPNDAHLRSSLQRHLTASALALDPARERMLLHFHKKLGRWLQFGGHCDGDANLLGVAWRETTEESGLDPQAISLEPVDLDVHGIPARPGEPEHEHWDVRFLVQIPAVLDPGPSPESVELRWFRPEETVQLGLDTSLQRLIALGFPDAGIAQDA